jgi:phosphoribosyl 1,2-cyclic phosphodiesterase
VKFAVLGSGSRGNASLVVSGAGTLLVDAGFGVAELRRRAGAVGLSLDSMTAVVITHEHGDHARGALAAARAFGCPVYASIGTLQAMAAEAAGADTRVLDVTTPESVGGFRLHAARTGHDAAEPIALRITDHQSGVRLGIAYDIGRLTPSLRRLLGSVHCLLLEANHDDHLLRTGPYPQHLRHRIAGPAGHLSNWQAGNAASELCHEELQTVVLAHLSEVCNRPELARDTVGAALAAAGFRGELHVAGQDVPLEPIEVRGRQLALDLFG